MLRDSPLLSNVSAATLQSLADAAETRKLEVGDAVLNPTPGPADLCYVTSGELHAIERSPSGKDELVRIIARGELVDEMQQLAGALHPVTVQVAQPSEIQIIPGSVVHTEDLLCPELHSALERLHQRQLLCRLYPIFGPLDAAFLDEVEVMADWVDLERGESLDLEGDRGESLFLIVSGRVEVSHLDSDGTRSAVAEAGRGETTGELAFFGGVRRGERITAVRDSVLVGFSPTEVEQLTARRPQILRHIMRTLVARFERTTQHKTEARVTNIAILPLTANTPVDEFARRLTEALMRIGPTQRLNAAVVASESGDDSLANSTDDSPQLNQLLAWLEAQEAAHRFVVLEADREATQWSERCVQLADRVLLIARANDSPHLSAIEQKLLMRESGEDLGTHEVLVLIHPDGKNLPTGTRRWLAERPTVEESFHVRWDTQSDFARLGRRLAGQGVGVVLGGGGARGFAHIGILRALQEIGIPIDAIGGTSMGSALAAQHALGWTPERIASANRRVFVELQPHKVYTLPVYSLVTNRKAMECGKWLYGEADIEDLWIPFFCISSDLTSAEMVIHRNGPLQQATMASASIPVFAPPILEGDHLLCDGAILNNVPADVMRQLGIGTVIAAEVSVEDDDVFRAKRVPSPWEIMRSKFIPRRQTIQFPSLLEVAMRVSVLNSIKRERVAMTDADLCLHPPIDKFSLMDFPKLDEIVEVGYDYARDVLGKWESAPGRNGAPQPPPA